MSQLPRKRFVFLGGIPTYDYAIHVDWEEISSVTGNRVFILDSKILVPVGTVFKIKVPAFKQTTYVNPLANVEVQFFQGLPYLAMEFGGKHPQLSDFTLRGDVKIMLAEMQKAFPEHIRTMKDLHVVDVKNPVEIVLGGNNRNLLDEMTALFASPELASVNKGLTFEHHFFADADNPKFELIRKQYGQMGVGLGPKEDMHVPGLEPRIGYVLTICPDERECKPLDRIILTNRTNEEVIPFQQLTRRYFALEQSFREREEGEEIHMIVNSLTNPEEARLIPRILQSAFASGVTTYLCPTGTTIRCVDKVLEGRYYTVEKERFFDYRRDFFFTSILPYVQYMILNRDELGLIDNMVQKKGIDETASLLAHRMNRGRHNDCSEGGRLVVTGGSKGARYTERLTTEQAAVFWKKAHLPSSLSISFAERRLVCGDDYVTTLVSTLGAGDTFTGIFIGLSALGWDGGHALRAATLGAQHYIQTRQKPRVADMIVIDEGHIRMGTETEMVDVISHHVTDTGHATRYGIISDTIITIRTSQIHHPFRETVRHALEVAKLGRDKAE